MGSILIDLNKPILGLGGADTPMDLATHDEDDLPLSKLISQQNNSANSASPEMAPSDSSGNHEHRPAGMAIRKNFLQANNSQWAIPLCRYHACGRVLLPCLTCRFKL
jgi:hypothetical protein